MDHIELLFKIMVTGVVLSLLGLVIYMFDALLLKPNRIRSKLRKQGVGGPTPAILLGNIREMRRIAASSISSSVPSADENQSIITHNYAANIHPFLHKWRMKYGPIFMFSQGNIPYLYVGNLKMVKEVRACSSFALGKPSEFTKQLGPLLGQSLVSSNGKSWEYQRKIIAPEFFAEKVKGMTSLMVESASFLMNSWHKRIECQGGMADIKIDEYLRQFSGDVIARACFGSNYAKGEEIFMKIRALREAMSKVAFLLRIPGTRFLPTKVNREIWRLGKEVDTLILKVVKERKETKSENDLLQKILEALAANSNGGGDTNQFIIDNCKSLYTAGFDSTAAAATWTLMLLALYPHWQDWIRVEVLDVCGSQLLLNADTLPNLKQLTMVIHESLRLYSPALALMREALEDVKFGDIQVPKGVKICLPVAALHQDPDIWGPDSHSFNPMRFAAGVSGACKHPYVYMPFGVGPRICLGQAFVMAELKILLAHIVSNFSFSLSPSYRHSPKSMLLVEPEHGVILHVKKQQGKVKLV